MTTVTLRIDGTESSIPTEELSIDRILSEARAAGLVEFNVYRDGEMITSPEEFIVTAGSIYVISPIISDKEFDEVIEEMAVEHEKDNPVSP